jgi:hypothetical protein
MAGALVTTNILQTAVALGLQALRERVVLPQLVNREYEQDIVGMKKGATVNVSVPAPITARSVSPDVVPPSLTAVTPTSVPITLDQWFEAVFAMDDKGIAQVQQGIVPMQLSEAIKAVANNIDSYLWGRIHAAGGVYGYAGVAGTTPFATDLQEYRDGRKIANNQLMDEDPRFFIMDTDADANALGIRAIQDATFRSNQGPNTLVSGSVGSILGAQWIYSQNVPTHSETNSPTGWLVNDAAHAAGASTLDIDTGSGDPDVGDIFTVAGDAQTYMVESFAAGTITHSPVGQVALANNAAITFAGDHVVNLLGHRDLMGFAMAPLAESAQTQSRRDNTATAVDPISGLSLRLEVTDQHKQTQWSIDALYGASVIRPEFGVRIAG